MKPATYSSSGNFNFSLYHVTIRPTKILREQQKLGTFKKTKVLKLKNSVKNRNSLSYYLKIILTFQILKKVLKPAKPTDFWCQKSFLKTISAG